MREFMYDKNSFLIAAVLFVSMVVVIEIGSWLGLRRAEETAESLKTQLNGLQGSLLGILALLLGFTFSQSLQRLDARSAAVVDEANAIGTAYLRLDLLPVDQRQASTQLMREYIETRIEAGSISMDREDERQRILDRSVVLQGELWRLAAAAANATDRPATVNLFIQALNELIDSNSSRNAALGRHVPELVLLLLYGTFLLTGALVGYASGVSGVKASRGTYVLVSLIVVLVFIIIDLDRPRRGLIEVDQSSLIELRQLTVPAESQAD